MSIVHWQQPEDRQLWLAGHCLSGEGNGAVVPLRPGEQHACVADIQCALHHSFANQVHQRDWLGVPAATAL